MDVKEQGQYCEFCKLRFTGHCPTKTMLHKVNQVVLFEVRYVTSNNGLKEFAADARQGDWSIVSSLIVFHRT